MNDMNLLFSYLFHDTIYFLVNLFLVIVLVINYFFDKREPLKKNEIKKSNENVRQDRDSSEERLRQKIILADFFLLAIFIILFIFTSVYLWDQMKDGIIGIILSVVIRIVLILLPIVLVQYNKIDFQTEKTKFLSSIFLPMTFLLAKASIEGVFTLYIKSNLEFKFIFIFIIYSAYYFVVLFAFLNVFLFLYYWINNKINVGLDFIDHFFTRNLNKEDRLARFHPQPFNSPSPMIIIFRYFKDIPRAFLIMIKELLYATFEVTIIFLNIIVLFIKKIIISDTTIDDKYWVKKLILFSMMSSIYISYLILIKMDIMNSFEKEVLNLLVTATLIPYVLSRLIEQLNYKTKKEESTHNDA